MGLFILCAFAVVVKVVVIGFLVHSMYRLCLFEIPSVDRRISSIECAEFTEEDRSDPEYQNLRNMSMMGRFMAMVIPFAVAVFVWQGYDLVMMTRRAWFDM
jgi:hypothetical protein